MSRLIRLVPGLAIPAAMDFLLELCEPVRYTRKAIEAGDLLKIDYHPISSSHAETWEKLSKRLGGGASGSIGLGGG